MKKLIFLFILTISFISCDEKNGIDLNNGSEIPLELKKSVTKHFSGGHLTTYDVTRFQNKRWKSNITYNSNNELVEYTKWDYDPSNFNLLSSLKSYDENRIEIPEKTVSFFYDTEKRLIKIERFNETITFTYNSNFSITKTSSLLGTTTLLFHRGFISKITSDITETDFITDDNLIRQIKHTDIATDTDTGSHFISYNTIVNPKGFLYRNLYINTFGNSRNAFLQTKNTTDSGKIFTIKHVVRIEEKNGTINSFTLTFNDEEYLKKMDKSVNNNLISTTEYFYE